MVKRTSLLAAATASISVLLAACGGSGAPAGGTAPEAPLAAPPVFALATVIGADNVGIAQFALVGSTRISRTVFEYTYTAAVSNGGTEGATITATLASTAASTTVVDGALNFGDVAQGATSVSVDTFTIRQDRTVPFDENALVWTVQLTPLPPATSGSVVIDHASVFFGAVGQTATLNAQVFDAQGAPVNAIVAWSSSAPEQVSVDATGRIEAGSIGSAQIFAESGGLRSAPVFVIVAEPQPGALLVTDEQVLSVGPPIGLAPDAIAGVGTHYEVRLQGIAAPPSPGTVVLAAENAAVAGKVVSTRDEAGTLVVTLEFAPLYELLARYDIAWNIDLAAYTPVADPIGTEAFSPLAISSATDVFATSAGGMAARTSVLRVAPQAATSVAPFQAFNCDASLVPTLLKREINISPEFDMQLVIEESPGHSKRAVVGSAKLVGSAAIKLSPGFRISGSCLAQATVNIPIGGVALVVMPGVRFGLGVGLEGLLAFAPGELSVTGAVGVSHVLGWECGGSTPGCRSLEETTPINEFKPKAEVPNIEDMRVGVSGQFFVLVGLDAVFFTQFHASILEARIGPVQTLADIALEADQALIETFASKYDLKLEAVVEPGAGLQEAINAVINNSAVGVTFKAKVTKDISESPKGTFTVSKGVVGLGGDTVDFTVNLQPATTDYFLIGYNVKQVELWRKKSEESAFTRFHTIAVSGSNQSTFQYTWQPDLEDIGPNEFAAFVLTEFPVPALEVTENSVREVDVRCFTSGAQSAALAGRSQALAAAAAGPATCADTWVGSASFVSPDIRFDASVTWRPDPNIPEILGDIWYVATGTVTVKYLYWERQGCSVTPTTFDVAESPDASVLLVEYAETPPIFSTGGETGGPVTIYCPGQDPEIIETSQLILWLTGSGEVSADGTTIEGTTTSGDIEWTWSFARP